MSREILCVKREILFKDKEFQGYCSLQEKDFLKEILQNLEYVHRDDALENNPSFQQIIPYVWITNPQTKKIFLYQRSKGGDEGRLYNKYSGGVGGHIDRDTDESADNPVTAAMIRELQEEIIMNQYPAPEFIGFINDDSDSVGKVHFGVVALAKTTEEIKPAMHMASGQFFTVQEVEEIFSNPQNAIENWTRISWPMIKMYLDLI